MSRLSVAYQITIRPLILLMALAAVIATVPAHAEGQPPENAEMQQTEGSLGALVESPEKTAEQADGQPAYVALEPEFTVNYGQKGRRLRYLKAAVALEVTDSEAALEVNTHSDAIRHEIIMMISEQTVEEVHSAQSRQEMQQELRKRLRELMERETDRPMIQQVLFTAFVVQS